MRRRQPTKEVSQSHRRVRSCAVHTRDTRKFCFKMSNRALVGIMLIEIAEGAFEQMKNLGFVMFDLGTDFDQFDEIRRGLSAPMIGSNSGERIEHHNLAQGMQIRFTTFRN